MAGIAGLCVHIKYRSYTVGKGASLKANMYMCFRKINHPGCLWGQVRKDKMKHWETTWGAFVIEQEGNSNGLSHCDSKHKETHEDVRNS